MTKIAPILEVRNLSKDYKTDAGPVRVLESVDLRLYPGELTAIMGPSGSGKSSFMFILGLLQPADSGSYIVKGKDVFSLSRKQRAEFRRNYVGFVFQSANMFEHSSVYENLEYPLIYSRVPKRKRKKMILDSLEKVNLSHRVNHPTNRLSGGEQQRVAIARALVNNPLVLLGDEPTGQLDTKNGERILDYFKMNVASAKTAMLLVTHDPKVADKCDKAYFLENGQLTQMQG